MCDVVTLGVVTRSRLLTPLTLDLTMSRVPRLMSAACFSSVDSLPMRTFCPDDILGHTTIEPGNGISAATGEDLHNQVAWTGIT